MAIERSTSKLGCPPANSLRGYARGRFGELILKLASKLGAFAALVVATFCVHAVDYRTEYGKKVGQSQQIGPLGDSLAGDQISYFTGALEFSATDVSLPGNFSLSVAVGRRFVVEPSRDIAHSSASTGVWVQRAFGDWDLDIPYLSGTFARPNGWDVNTSTPTARCSSATTMFESMPRANVLTASNFWHGNTLHLPGQGEQTMLLALTSNTNRPSAGGPFYWTTNKHWWFSCLGATKNNAGGEAFVAHAPDGTKYQFDWLSTRYASVVTKDMLTGHTAKQLRSDVFLLPSRITDRFGNTVDFTYSNDAFAKLQSVTSSDGRTISLTYNASGYVASVTDGTRTWLYSYTGGRLTQVTLPDASTWQFGLSDDQPDTRV